MPLELNGYTAHIDCDGAELEAYGVEKQNPHTISCWVASEEGKRFSVRWGDKSALTYMSVAIHIDGRLSTGRRVPETGPVHEKSKKAGVHTVSFGDAENCENSYVYKPIGLEKEPFATFIFRYRPIALLQANGIVPLPPRPDKGKKRPSDTLEGPRDPTPSGSKHPRTSPSAKAEPVDEDDNDDEHLTFLEEQLMMMQQRVEQARAAKRSRTVIKREVSPIRVPSSSHNEIIDLT
ncbi:hypothetical protein C8Q79DRAFT_153488 [Trametes meyenii]|nr:hypothetical protein C8Q79DRAFT_153488 [Trametes meyenii]